MNTLNLAMLIEEPARRAPEKTFLVSGDQRLTYGQIETQARCFASGLSKLGISYGDKVALLVPNLPEYVISYYGIAKLGAVPVPMPVTAPGPEITYFLQDSEASALIAYETLAPAALEGFEKAGTCRHLIIVNSPGSDACPPSGKRYQDILATGDAQFKTATTQADDIGVILYTSGTTGRPKGAVLSNLSNYFTAFFMARDFWVVYPEDVVLIIAPTSHIFGNTLMNMACAAHATIVLLPRFEPQSFLQTIEKEKVTFFAGVTNLAYFLMNAPIVKNFDVSSLRSAMIGGDMFPTAAAKRMNEQLNMKISYGYGMTEGVPITYLNPSELLNAPSGSVGLPAFGTQIRIVDENDRDVPAGERGELIVRGPQMLTGYYNKPEANALEFRGGWFHTGDIAYIDENGYVFLVDRLKDLIKYKGYSVFPAEIERVILTMPAVAQVAVVGIPSETAGQEAKAYVVLKPNMTLSAEEVIAYCQSQLTAYKCPRLVEFREKLPTTPSGKVLKRAIQ